MLFFYVREIHYLIVLVVFLFSLVFGMNSMAYFDLPFSPWFQIFFLLFQTIIFYLIAENEYYKKKR